MKLLEWLFGKKTPIVKGQHWVQNESYQVKYSSRNLSSYIVINDVSDCGTHVLYSWVLINGSSAVDMPHEYELSAKLLRRMFTLMEKEDVQ